VFDFGDVTNLNSNGSAATVVITFQAVVLDILANQAGVAWTNAASFTSPASGTTNVVSAAITVVEPTLHLSEQISTDNSAYGAGVGPLQAGTRCITGFW